MTHHVTLLESTKRANMQTRPDYDVYVNGVFVGNIYFNLTGYVGYLPLPGGKKFNIGERSLAAYKKEIAIINREAKLEVGP